MVEVGGGGMLRLFLLFMDFGEMGCWEMERFHGFGGFDGQVREIWCVWKRKRSHPYMKKLKKIRCCEEEPLKSHSSIKI